jgi:hypothetical protein
MSVSGVINQDTDLRNSMRIRIQRQNRRRITRIHYLQTTLGRCWGSKQFEADPDPTSHLDASRGYDEDLRFSSTKVHTLATGLHITVCTRTS